MTLCKCILERRLYVQSEERLHFDTVHEDVKIGVMDKSTFMKKYSDSFIFIFDDFYHLECNFFVVFVFSS